MLFKMYKTFAIIYKYCELKRHFRRHNLKKNIYKMGIKANYINIVRVKL